MPQQAFPLTTIIESVVLYVLSSLKELQKAEVIIRLYTSHKTTFIETTNHQIDKLYR